MGQAGGHKGRSRAGERFGVKRHTDPNLEILLHQTHGSSGAGAGEGNSRCLKSSGYVRRATFVFILSIDRRSVVRVGPGNELAVARAIPAHVAPGLNPDAGDRFVAGKRPGITA